MLVCHCKGVSERAVRDAIRRGAASSTEVGRACGAGSVCGGCRPVIAELLHEHAEAREPSLAGLDLAPAR